MKKPPLGVSASEIPEGLPVQASFTWLQQKLIERQQENDVYESWLANRQMMRFLICAIGILAALMVYTFYFGTSATEMPIGIPF